MIEPFQYCTEINFLLPLYLKFRLHFFSDTTTILRKNSPFLSNFKWSSDSFFRSFFPTHTHSPCMPTFYLVLEKSVAQAAAWLSIFSLRLRDIKKENSNK